MSRLIVRNIGPIKDIDIELSNVNVFMGPQGCGKSTLAKIISFCSWMEKDKEGVSKTLKDGIANSLMNYHRMKGYFNGDSQIAYFGDDVALFYHFLPTSPWHEISEAYNMVSIREGEVFFHKSEKTINPKVAYIPAERNFVSVIPHLSNYAEKDDSLQSFVTDWYDAKRNFTKESPLHIDLLNLDYYYNEKSDLDMIVEKGGPMALNQTSSGYQSVVPLAVMTNWLTEGIYKENKPFSPAEVNIMRNILAQISGSESEGMEQQVIDRIRGFLQGKVFTHTQLIVEEPEQNLFPTTQCELLYFMLNSLNHGRKHRMVLTTHSPYILYALNNCLLAFITKDDIPEDVHIKYFAQKIAIDPAMVRVWEIENGGLKIYENLSGNGTIQDEQGLIRKNYFNSIMKQVMSDFNNMLAFKD